jgi:hypothetical protein
MLLRSNNETAAPVDRNLHELLMNSRLQRAVCVPYPYAINMTRPP